MKQVVRMSCSIEDFCSGRRNRWRDSESASGSEGRETRKGSISRHARIDLFGPGQNAPFQVLDRPETLPAQKLLRLEAAHAAFAVNNDLSFTVELTEPLRQLGQGDQCTARYAADLILLGVPNIE